MQTVHFSHDNVHNQNVASEVSVCGWRERVASKVDSLLAKITNGSDYKIVNKRQQRVGFNILSR